MIPHVCLAAALGADASAVVRHRLTSRLLDGLSAWWHMPALIVGVAAVAGLIIWNYRRDAADLSGWRRVGLTALRLGALVAVITGLLDLELATESEVVVPSRVALLIDTSASMTLPERSDPRDIPEHSDPEATPLRSSVRSRIQRSEALLFDERLLAELRATHEVSIWRFDEAAERLALLEPAASGLSAVRGSTEDESTWRDRLQASGRETRFGAALARVLEQEPSGALAGVIVLTDGGHNSGIDPLAVATALAEAEVSVHPLGVGSETLPTNVRVADVLAPSRVVPDDGFGVTAYLQGQGLEGVGVRVELAEAASETTAAEPAEARVLDRRDATIGPDGDLVPVRFDVAGLSTAGRRNLVVRVVPPADDDTPEDDVQTTEIEVVDRPTRVLLMAGGPSREYQFMRNLLDRDRGFVVESLLGTSRSATGEDPSVGRARVAFPESDAELSEFDVIVGVDYDWRRLDAAARDRLERWVAQESGGLVFVAGNVFMESWAADPGLAAIRALVPVDLRTTTRPLAVVPQAEVPLPVRLTPEAGDAEFLRLAAQPAVSESLWNEFPGVYGCFANAGPKPGATVYLQAERPAAGGGSTCPYLVGQFYGAGTVLFIGSGELWRLRSVDERLHERLVTQLLRHASQGRLLRGSRRGSLLVDRDRIAVGSPVVVRVLLNDSDLGARPPVGRVRSPDGHVSPLPLTPDPGRPGSWRGSLVATREGAWQLEVDPAADAAGEPLARRLHAHLPDRELARPRLDRELLEALARATGGESHMLGPRPWTADACRTLAAVLPDRSRRDYLVGAADSGFKRRLNAALLGLGSGLLCLEWVVRRLSKLA
jgi:hypothetical protein